MASAALPLLFRAVEIDGVPYWDGGYSGNPAVIPFLRTTATEDVLIVQINPRERRKVPTRTREIMSRVNEINFNASLLSELRGVAFVNRLIDEGRLPRGTRQGEFRRLKLHRIVMEDLGDTFGARSTLKTDYEYFETLRKLGQRATRRFLDAHFNDIGRRSTIDIADKIEAELAETKLLGRLSRGTRLVARQGWHRHFRRLDPAIHPSRRKVASRPTVADHIAQVAAATSKRDAPACAAPHATLPAMAESVPSLLSAEVGASRLEICVADITTLDVDAIVNAANRDAARRRWRRRRHPSRRRPGAARPSAETLGRLRHRLRQDHPRLPSQGQARHPRGRAGLERRPQGRGGVARVLLSHRARRWRLSIASPRSPFPRSRPASTGFPPSARRTSPSAPWQRRSPARPTSRGWCSAASPQMRPRTTGTRSSRWGWHDVDVRDNPSADHAVTACSFASTPHPIRPGSSQVISKVGIVSSNAWYGGCPSKAARNCGSSSSGPSPPATPPAI